MKQIQSGLECAQFVTMTPDMAEDLLSKNSKNRTISQRRVSLYADAMKSGKWRVTHQGVSVFTDGILADGQHRLHAVLQANIDVIMLLVTGLHPDSIDGIDQHRARKVSDVAKIVGKDWLDTRGVAIVRMMFGLEASVASEVLSIADLVLPSVVFAKNAISKSMRSSGAPLLSAIALAHFHGIDESVLLNYGRVLSTGIMEDNQSEIAAFRMREWLMKNGKQTGSTERIRTLKAVMRNINHFEQGTPIVRVVVPDGYDFKILSAPE